jgi:HPt (histidine-containing phosphotransfer) domain-containing protein
MSSIDPQMIESIRSLDAPDLVAELVHIFLGCIPDRFAKIETAIRKNDPKGIQEVAHALKSSSANLGAKQMSIYCQELEALGKNGRTEGAQDLFLKLKAEHTLVAAELQALPELQDSEKAKAA